MSFRTVGFLGFAALVAIGCAEEPSGAAGTDPADGGAGGAGGAPASEQGLTLSFVAEDEAGVGPALLRMFNDTESDVLSLTVPTGEAFSFYLVEPQASTDYALVATADMLGDAILSLHTLDTCVRKPFSSIDGPVSLEPRRAYALHVADDFSATVVEEAQPAPFVGLRAMIDDPAQATQVGAKSRLVLSGAWGELAFDDIYDELPAPHVKVEAPELVIDEVRFEDLAGVVHVAHGPFAIGGATGYTVYVASEAVSGSVSSIALERAP